MHRILKEALNRDFDLSGCFSDVLEGMGTSKTMYHTPGRKCVRALLEGREDRCLYSFSRSVRERGRLGWSHMDVYGMVSDYGENDGSG